MRYTKVDSEGKVTEPPASQMAYAALLSGRMSIIAECADSAKLATTIAIRYGVVRRQFSNNGIANGNEKINGSFQKNELETVLLDYKIHQKRLFPLLALTYAMIFASLENYKKYERLMHRFKRGQSDDPADDAAILKQTHGTSAAIKAFFSWRVLDMIERCRQACGGFGYSSYTGLASLFNDVAVHCTWEGDNTIMTLQTGRFLLSAFRDRIERKEKRHSNLSSEMSFLNNFPQILDQKYEKSTKGEITNLNVLAEAFDVIVSHLLAQTGKAFTNAMKMNGVTINEALEKCSMERLAVANFYCVWYLFNCFKEAISKAPEDSKSILTSLCQLYSLTMLSENTTHVIKSGYFSIEDIGHIDQKVTNIPITITINQTCFVDYGSMFYHKAPSYSTC